MAQAGDPAILARAQTEGSVLVTCDKDFGELAIHSRLPAECGVVLLRLAGRDPARDNARAIEAITSRTTWAGSFVVVEDDRVRTRPIPTAAE